MPIHDWTRVDAGIFHHFHHSWIEELQRALNDGLLPGDYYALAEQVAGRLGPDVLTLQRPPSTGAPASNGGAVAVEKAPPRTRFHLRAEESVYAAKAKAVAVRHRSNHKVVALVEVVSPGNKNSQHGLRAFRRKAEEALAAGVHLLILDLLPPGPRDPQGLHPLIWGGQGEAFTPPEDKPLSLLAYVGSPGWEAYIEPVAVGDGLPEMPLFLDTEEYVSVPLAPTYDSAWRALPAFWRDVVGAAGP